MANPVTLWIADLATTAGPLLALERAAGLLTVPERQRADAIANAAHRDRWIAAHVVLHVALGRAVGRRVAFASAGPAAKPRIAEWPGDFSLTHSGTLVMAAATADGPVGVDVEMRRAVTMSASRMAMIEAAAAALDGGATAARRGHDATMHFLAAWTRLEAVAKATGLGMAHVLGEAGLIGARSAAPQDVRRVRDLLALPSSQRLTVADIDLASVDAVGAVAMPLGAPLIIQSVPDRLDALRALVADLD